MVFTTLRVWIFGVLCAAAATACSGASNNGLASIGAGVGLTGDSKGDSSSSSSDSNDSEHAKANAPQQVTGSFLTCAYMDNETDAIAAVKGRRAVEFGCGLYNHAGGSLQPTDIGGLRVQTGIRCVGSHAEKAPASALPRGGALQFKIEVTVEQLPCMVAMVLAGTDGMPAAFGKSLSTVTQTDAASGFDIGKDVLASGITFSANGQPNFPASPNASLYSTITSHLDAANQAELQRTLKNAPLSAGGKVPVPDASDDSTVVQSTPPPVSHRRPTAAPAAASPDSNPAGGDNGGKGGQSASSPQSGGAPSSAPGSSPTSAAPSAAAPSSSPTTSTPTTSPTSGAPKSAAAAGASHT